MKKIVEKAAEREKRRRNSTEKESEIESPRVQVGIGEDRKEGKD